MQWPHMAEVEIGIGQVGPSGLRVRRHRHRAQPPHARPGGRRHLLGDRRLPLRAAAHGLRHGRRRRPATAIEIGRLGGVGVLNLEGLWTRYEDPEPLFEEIAELADREGHPADAGDLRRADQARADRRPRIREIQDAGVVARASVTPQRTERCAKAILDAELDLLVIQGTVVSAEHVSKTVEPLNLKRSSASSRCPSSSAAAPAYQAALHLMRTGAVGVLVGVGPGHACTTRGVLGIGVPQATAIADARPPACATSTRPASTCHVIADGGMGTGGDIAKAIVCGADARDDRLAARRRRRGARAVATTGAWPRSTRRLPRGAGADRRSGARSRRSSSGPAHENDGRMNLFGALRTSMATCGYETVKEFQKAEVMVAPALQTEGKSLQRAPAAWAWVTDCEPGVDTRPRRRLRRPVRPAHRPSGPRGRRLPRDRAPHDHRRRGAPSGAGRRDLQRRPEPRSTSTARPSIDPPIYDLGRPDPGHLLRRPARSPSSSAARSPHGPRRVRPHRAATVTGERASLPRRRPAGPAAGVDEPLRHDHRGA